MILYLLVCIFYPQYIVISLKSQHWRNQTRASQGIAQASSYTALPSALRPD